MIKYARITTTEGQRFILRITKESDKFVTGTEVDKDGEEVVPRGGFHNRVRIVERTAIRTRVEMRMNNTYATLEEVPS